MPSGLLTTPRPEPSHLLPAVAGSIVVALSLPVFLLVGWNVKAWALAALLWLTVHAVDVVLRHVRRDTHNYASSGLQVVGLLFKMLALLVALFAAAAADPHLALGAAVVYALAYTLELGVSLASYFGGTR
jgi:hypothetical protein